MTTAAPTLPDVAGLTFEKALAELETIVGRLEKGDVALEDSIAAYERGEALKARCAELLSTAEARVEKIRLSADGRPAGARPRPGPRGRWRPQGPRGWQGQGGTSRFLSFWGVHTRFP